MKTARVIDGWHVGLASNAPSCLRSVASRFAVNTVSLRLRQARAQVEALERALASSQQKSIAAQQQVEILTKANALLEKKFVVQRDYEVAKLSQPAYWDGLTMTDFSLCPGLDPDATTYVEQLLTKRVRFRRGDLLYRVGDRFNALYAIRTGSCKTVLLAMGGQDQVAGYHMAGEIIGMDGIGTDLHKCQATALEDMDVCPLPFDEIENLARRSDQFGRNLHRLLSQETARAQTLMLVLGTMRAEQRLAVFLLDLSQRYGVRGYSSCEFVLRMTRQEIGSYLGLKLETVSRMLSRFQREGLIQVQGRTVKLLDRIAVRYLVDCDA